MRQPRGETPQRRSTCGAASLFYSSGRRLQPGHTRGEALNTPTSAETNRTSLGNAHLQSALALLLAPLRHAAPRSGPAVPRCPASWFPPGGSYPTRTLSPRLPPRSPARPGPATLPDTLEDVYRTMLGVARRGGVAAESESRSKQDEKKEVCSPALRLVSAFRNRNRIHAGAKAP